MMVFAVRWKDDKGNDQRKEYKTEPDARKARDWLLERGAKDVDIAIVVGERQIVQHDKAPATPPAPQYQQMFGDKS